MKGKHELRFGFDMVRHQLNHWSPHLGDPRGNFSFSGNITARRNGPGETFPAANNLNSFADFLLGYPTSMAKAVQNILLTGREWQFGWYARDRWQVGRNLTVNLGLRLEHYPLMTRANSGVEKVDPSTMLVRLGGYGTVPTNSGIEVQSLFLAPRVGIAYRITENTVFRVGYGMTIDPLPFSRPLQGFYPLTITGNFVGADQFEPFRTLSEGIPAIPLPDLSTGVVPLPPTADMRTPGDRINRGYIQSWNATLQRKLPGNLIVDAGYVGTQTTNQLADLDINAAAPGAGNAGRPYAAQFGRRIALNYWDGYLSSNYHSLQTSVNRSFSNGLLIKGAYTWSKAINMTDEDGWAGVSYNWLPVFDRNRAVAGYDRTQVFQLGWVYELPFGRSKSLLRSGVGTAVLGGSSVNGVAYAYSGTPFTCNCKWRDAERARQSSDCRPGGACELHRKQGAGPVLLRPRVFHFASRRALRNHRTQRSSRARRSRRRSDARAKLPDHRTCEHRRPRRCVQRYEHSSLRQPRLKPGWCQLRRHHLRVGGTPAAIWAPNCLLIIARQE